jgi:hypothetical protein
MAKFAKTRTCAKSTIYPEVSDSANRPYSDSHNSEIGDQLESDSEPSKSGESYLTGWYLAIRDFQICLLFGILFLPILVPSRTDSRSLSVRKIP